MKKPYSNKNYAELCKKLGKEKLLIEEDDEDISSLIYQGMAKNDWMNKYWVSEQQTNFSFFFQFNK